MARSSIIARWVIQAVLLFLTALLAIWIGQAVLPRYHVFDQWIYKGTGIPGAGIWVYFLFPAAAAMGSAGMELLWNTGKRSPDSLQLQLTRLVGAALAAILFSWVVLSVTGEVFSKRLLLASGLMLIMIGLVPVAWYRLFGSGRAGTTAEVREAMAPGRLLPPVMLLAFYALLYTWLTEGVLPEGVTTVFTGVLSVSLLGVSGVLLLAVGYLLLWSGVRPKWEWRRGESGMGAGSLLLLGVIIAPVMQYILANRAILDVMDILIILGIILLVGLILGYGMPLLLRSVMHWRVSAAVGMAFLLTVINMAALSQVFAWYEKGNIWTQLLVLGAGFALFWVLSGLQRMRDLALVVSVYFIFASGGIQIFTFTEDEEVNSSTEVIRTVFDHSLMEIAQEEVPVRTPNIYLLVYESYVTGETMAGYGIDNSEQEQYLEDEGFVHYAHTYSIGADTTNSMNRVFSASDWVYGGPRKAVSGDGVVQSILNQLGYVTYGIFSSDYFFREGNTPAYDVFYPSIKTVEPYAYLLSAIAVGEFRFNLEEDLEFAEISFEEFSQCKWEVFSNVDGERRFVYTHTPIPQHSQNSRACLFDEVEQYEERLGAANMEMRRDLSLLLENDPGAIIIVAGDHGPYLTKNCTQTIYGGYTMSEISRLDIQDRYGAFLAVRWPNGERYGEFEIRLLQNLFPAVFLYMFGEIPDESFVLDRGLALREDTISGVNVIDGIIVGGVDDGESLFVWE